MADAVPTEQIHNSPLTTGEVKKEALVNGSSGSNGYPKPPRGLSKAQQMNKLYSLPAPLRTFPLPTFVPHNPISLFHILYTWISQTVQVPNSHPDVPYLAWYSPETRSVHVTDPTAIRALWQQGFYGKGSLSRSELSWLDREKRRTGKGANQTSEEVTRQRRAARQQAKWERARKEREAIDQTLAEERGLVLDTQSPRSKNEPFHLEEVWQAPVGPMEILRLPNSVHDLLAMKQTAEDHTLCHEEENDFMGNGDATNSVPNRANGHVSSKADQSATLELSSPDMESLPTLEDGLGDSHTNGATNGATVGPPESVKSTRSQKSVRFSPTVEKTTFIPSDPPSPNLPASSAAQGDEEAPDIRDQEHLQLTMEEAFFLSYGLGVLMVLDRKTKGPLSTKELFSLGRQSSYFPPSELPLLSPDDPFMLSYIVYHHFRSLGWVVRGGTKFSVDYLLYNRGPVFSHAEFAILILPSYSDPYWSANAETKEYVSKKETRHWSWLHCVNRVNSQVKKTLVLVYVDIPPPLPSSSEDDLGIDGILKRYKVREIILKRWISNRSRD